MRVPELGAPSRIPVTFVLGERWLLAEADPGSTLIEVAREAGILLAASCSGRGTCGTCAVHVLEGELLPPDSIEQVGLRRAREGLRLACRARVSGPVTVRPVVVVPHAEDAAAAGVAAGTSAAGVDLGTTTIAARMVGDDPSQPAVSVVNPQMGFGADVASRLAAARRGAWLELQAAAVRGTEEALALACAQAGCAGVARAAVAANTAMAHLLLGADVSSLAVSPHQPSYSGTVRVSAGRFGSRLAAKIVVLPHLGGFVGGDATAAAIALGLDEAKGVELMLDVGTNAEIVLSVEGRLKATSAAAGPAFEGAGISCGGPAVDGAVIALDADPSTGALRLHSLGSGEPMWLAGSGVLDAIVALRDAGHIDRDGRFIPEGPYESGFHKRHEVLVFQVAGSAGEPGDVYLTQLDVRQVQLAKAAVALATGVLLENAGVQWTDLSAVHLAGAFGTALTPHALTALGVIPDTVARIAREAGNAALAGAVMVAADDRLEERAEKIAMDSDVLDLAQRKDFSDRLLDAVAFPGS